MQFWRFIWLFVNNWSCKKTAFETHFKPLSKLAEQAKMRIEYEFKDYIMSAVRFIQKIKKIIFSLIFLPFLEMIGKIWSRDWENLSVPLG